MKGTLKDLNLTLHEEMERLMDIEPSDKNFDFEVKRANAVANISKQIITTAQTVLAAVKYNDEYGGTDVAEVLGLEDGRRT